MADQYNKLTAAYPMKRTWGYVTPSVSLQHLYTQFDQESADANGLDKNSKANLFLYRSLVLIVA
ncbi:MAG: hypothetical protein U1E98_06695 [Moraxella osloensis]